MTRRIIEPGFEDGQRVLLFCRGSTSVAIPAGSHEHDTAAQEDQLLSRLKQHSTARLHVTVVKCSAAGSRASLPHPVALRRNGFRIIMIASPDRVARGEAGQEWLKQAARAGIHVIVADQTRRARE